MIIGFNIEEFVRDLQLVRANLLEFPEPSEMRDTQGEGAGVTVPFTQQMRIASSALAGVTRTVRSELEVTHEAIRKTVEDLAATDESLADEAEIVLAVLDAVMQTPVADVPADPNAGF